MTEWKVDHMPDGTIRVIGEMTATELGLVVAGLYDAYSMTHDEVTTWLEERCPEFRKALSLVRFEDGSMRWAYVQPSVGFRITQVLE